MAAGPRKRVSRLAEMVFERSEGQMNADHARRSDEHLVFGTADGIGGHAGRFARVRQTDIARRRVGVAGVDEHRAGGTVRHAVEVFARHGNRRRAEHVLREHARCRARLVGNDKRQIELVAVSADARMHAAGRKPVRARHSPVYHDGEIRRRIEPDASLFHTATFLQS